MPDLSFRSATPADAEPYADLATAADPDEPADPVLVRWWMGHPDPAWITTEEAVELEGRLAGMLWTGRSPWERVDRRYTRIGGTLAPALAARHWHAFFERGEAQAAGDGAEQATAIVRESRPDLFELLAARGYRRERVERVWEVDLVAGRERLLRAADEARRRMQAQGLAITTLAGDADPERRGKLHRLTQEGEADVPSTVPVVPTPYEGFERWLTGPTLRDDRIFLARDGEAVVGLSMLGYPPVRGHVRTEFTTTARSHRGRGIARALKLETLAQAISLGVQRVRTENDGENAPILHLNADLGYHSVPGRIELHRRL